MCTLVHAENTCSRPMISLQPRDSKATGQKQSILRT